MSYNYYLWRGQEVFALATWEQAARIENHFVYDPSEVEADDRWGMIAKGRWFPRDPVSIPPEFKTRLLIMGVL